MLGDVGLSSRLESHPHAYDDYLKNKHLESET